MYGIFQCINNTVGDTYCAYRLKWQKHVLRSSPVRAVRILPLLQDVLLAFEVFLRIAHPATRKKNKETWLKVHSKTFTLILFRSVLGKKFSTLSFAPWVTDRVGKNFLDLLRVHRPTDAVAHRYTTDLIWFEEDRYLQTTKYLYRAHCRQCLLVLVPFACFFLLWFFLQVVHVAVDLYALAFIVGLLKD